MRALLLTIPLLIVAIPGMATEPPGWSLFAPEDGDFQILLPSVPETTTKSRGTLLGDVVETRHLTTWSGGEASVEHHDIPSLAVHMVPDDLILEQASDSLVEHEKGIESLSRSYTWNGHPALEVTYEIPGDTPLLERSRLILVETRLYLLSANWKSPSDIPPEVRNFLNSFELTPAVSAGTD